MALTRRDRDRRALLAGAASMLGIRAGEGRMVGWVAALFAVVQASHGLGANTADTLFFLRFGVEFLPMMILMSGPVVMLATLGHTAGLARAGAGRWLVVVLWALAGWVALERIGVAFDVPGIYPVVWLGGQVAILVSFTALWNTAAEVCTTRQAKRLFPLFASAGIGGGIVGNALTGPLAVLLGTENLLLVHAALLAAGAVLLSQVVRPLFSRRDTGPPESTLTGLRAGLDLTRRTPLLRLAAGVALGISGLFFLVVFPFAEAVTVSLSSETEVAAYLGTFSAVATGATLLVSLFVANRLFARIGVVATLLIVPLVYLAGFSLWIVTFGLATATLVRGAQWIAVNALAATAWSSLFNVLPDRRRGQVLSFMMAIPAQLGTVLGGLLLILGAGLPVQGQAAIGLAAALVTAVLVVRMRRAYTAALVEAVQQGLTEVFSTPTPGMQKPALDADTAAALASTLEHAEPGARAVAASICGRLDPSGEAEVMAPALRDPDPRVRVAALEGLAEHPSAIPLAQQLLADPAPEVRRSAIRILDRHDAELGASAAAALDDPDPTVRATAAALAAGAGGGGDRVLDQMLRSNDPTELEAALTALAGRTVPTEIDPAVHADHAERRVRAAAAGALAGRLDAVDVLRPLLDDPSLRVRAAAAEALAANEATRHSLFEVLATGSVRACDAALRALTDAGVALEDLGDWIAAEVDRARKLRRHAAALSDGAAGSTRASLARLLRTRQERLQRWALLALSPLAMNAAMPVIRRGVWSSDPETRAQALEALESIADRAIARDLIALFEEEPPAANGDPRATLRELGQDFDEWIRALALRCLAEELAADLDQLHRASDNDPSALVRAAVARRTPAPMDETRILDMVDRVIALQRLPMFATVDPEDLERIAAVMTERRYGSDEVVFRAGSPGTEMLMIISGEVEVRRDDGALIRRIGPGEHVGELALLSGRPRAADVVAGAEGVHGLVLGELELKAILEERPEVATAMLATLAERLATM